MPPIMGPRAGPINGMKALMANDLPLSSAVQQSFTIGRDTYTSWVSYDFTRRCRYGMIEEPILTANSALAPSPDMNLPTIINPRLFDIPQRVFQRTYHALPPIHIGLLPNTSLSGASNMGPNANARIYMDKARDASASEIRRSWPMTASPGANMAPDMSVTRPPRLVKIAVAHFAFWDQLRGLVGSEGESQATSIKLVSFVWYNHSLLLCLQS